MPIGRQKGPFGQHIAPDCAYCANHDLQQGCLRGKALKNGRCVTFDYDPLRRMPKTAPPIPVPDEKEFIL